MKCLISMQKSRAYVDLFTTIIQQWRYRRVNSLSILAPVFSCSSKLHIKIMDVNVWKVLELSEDQNKFIPKEGFVVRW